MCCHKSRSRYRSNCGWSNRGWTNVGFFSSRSAFGMPKGQITGVVQSSAPQPATETPPGYVDDNARAYIDEKADPPAYSKPASVLDNPFTMSYLPNAANTAYPTHLLAPLVAKHADNLTVKADLNALYANLQAYMTEQRCRAASAVKKAGKKLGEDVSALEEKDVVAVGGRWGHRERKEVKEEIWKFVQELLQWARE